MTNILYINFSFFYFCSLYYIQELFKDTSVPKGGKIPWQTLFEKNKDVWRSGEEGAITSPEQLRNRTRVSVFKQNIREYFVKNGM